MNLIEIAIDEYKPHPRNPNTHPDNQVGALESSLDDFGQYKNVVVWNGFYLAGHGLVEAAKRQGRRTLYAQDVSHLSEDKAIALMVGDNRLPELAVMDTDLLAELIGEFDDPLVIPGVDNGFLETLAVPSFQPVGPDSQPSLDQAFKTICPECGCEFTPRYDDAKG